MDRSSIYYKQVQLLMQVLPFAAKQTCFALKGGTAINLFVREFPRLSVDIDLVYLPMKARDEALDEICDESRRKKRHRAALKKIQIPDFSRTFPDRRRFSKVSGRAG